MLEMIKRLKEKAKALINRYRRVLQGAVVVITALLGWAAGQLDWAALWAAIRGLF